MLTSYSSDFSKHQSTFVVDVRTNVLVCAGNATVRVGLLALVIEQSAYWLVQSWAVGRSPRRANSDWLLTLAWYMANNIDIGARSTCVTFSSAATVFQQSTDWLVDLDARYSRLVRATFGKA